MNIPVRSKKQLDVRKAYQDKHAARESWHKLVVKILNWKGGSLKESTKITSREWVTYCQGVLKTNITAGRQKTHQSLNEIKELIRNHGGFSD